MKFSTAALFLFLGSASAAREWKLEKPKLTVSCNLITVVIVDYDDVVHYWIFRLLSLRSRSEKERKREREILLLLSSVCCIE